jgi:flagellar protein FlgJ
MEPIATAPAATVPTAQALAANKKAKDSAQDFEAVFLGQMTSLLLENVQTDEQFGGGHGEEMFKGILAEKLGKQMAKVGGIGLAPAVMDQIIKLQQGSKS